MENVLCVVIDDDRAFVDSLKRFLRGIPGIVYVICNNVEEALRAIQAYTPSIIFLDHSLTPGGNEGIEIVKRILQEPTYQGVKIYSTTAMGDPDLISAYEAYGIEVIGKSNFNKIKEILQTGN